MSDDEGFDAAGHPGVLVAVLAAFVLVGLSCVGMLADRDPSPLRPLPDATTGTVMLARR